MKDSEKSSLTLFNLILISSDYRVVFSQNTLYISLRGVFCRSLENTTCVDPVDGFSYDILLQEE